MVNSGGGAFNIIQDFRNPDDDNVATTLKIINTWGPTGENFLRVFQNMMTTTLTLQYKIYA